MAISIAGIVMFKATVRHCLDDDAVRRMAEEAGCDPLLLHDPSFPLDWLYAFAASIEARVREDAAEAADEALAQGISIAMDLKG